MSKNFDYDVGIIGAGVAGVTAALQASKNGLSVVLFEKRNIGGLSFNGGDLLMHNLFNFLADYSKIKNLGKYGVSTDHDKTNYYLDLPTLFKNFRKVRTEFLKNYINLYIDDARITVVRHEATIVNKDTIVADGKTYTFKKIILAHGLKARTLNIPGEENAFKKGFILKSHQLLNLKTTPKEVVIIGGGTVAIELATFFSALKIKTTILARYGYLTNLDQEIRNKYLDLINNRYLTIIDEVEFLKFEDSVLMYKKDENIIEKSSDVFMLAIGSYFDSSVNKNINLIYDNFGIVVDGNGQTNLEDVYAIGDCNNQLKFSSHAMAEALAAVNHIIGQPTPVNYDLFIKSITSLIEYAFIGKNEDELIKNNIPYIKRLIQDDDIGHSNKDIHFVKILIHTHTREILGIAIIARKAAEQMQVILDAINNSSRFEYQNKYSIFSSAFYVGKKIADLLKNFDLELLENNFISLYQAKVNNNNKVIGVESLARFYFDDGFKNPLPFIEVFEKNGIIPHLDFKVVENACHLINKLKTNNLLDDNFVVACNVSPLTLHLSNPSHIVSIVRKYGVNPKYIVLEVTERAFEEDINIMKQLEELQKLGFKISMDDFSVGNSSLTFLNAFNFDEIKIDRSLLPKDSKDEASKVVFDNIINLLLTQKQNIIIEGVETEYQKNYLNTYKDIKGYQGWYFARPMSEEALIKYLKERRVENNGK